MYSSQIRATALALRKRKTVQGPQNRSVKKLSTRAAANLLGVKSHQTILDWEKAEAKGSNVPRNLALRGRKRKLSGAEETKIVAAIEKRRSTCKFVNIEQIKEIAKKVTRGRVKLSP